MKYCVYVPKNPQRAKLLRALKSNFGYKIASVVYNKVTSDTFIDKYKESLQLEEGIPTYESIMKLPIVQNYIGDTRILQALNAKQPHIADNINNVKSLLMQAQDFNKENKDYIAILDYDENNDLTLVIERRNRQNIETATAQLKIQQTNEKIAEILGGLGISIGQLSQIETAKGRVGNTNFRHLKEFANNFTKIIRVANNFEGYVALSEEFSHFLIGVYRNTNFVQRTVNLLSDEGAAREVLGDEYDDVFNYHNGDASLIAEEAAGKILSDILRDRDSQYKSRSLFQRMVDFIVNKFKGLNHGYFEDSLNSIERDLSAFAQNILSGQKKISKKSIYDAQREVDFNALSERGQKQIDALKKIEEDNYKLVALQQDKKNEEDLHGARYKTRKIAESLTSIVRDAEKKEETMAAICEYLDIADADLDDLYQQVLNLENANTQDKFITLMNVMRKLQCYAPTLKALKDITSADYLRDEGIQQQQFMIEDSNNSLSPYEEKSDIDDSVPTGEMSQQEIADLIVTDSEEWELDESEEFYVNKKDGRKAMRVTKVITADASEGAPMDPDDPFAVPSSNIGTGLDELVRDFLSGRIQKDGDSYSVDGEPLWKVYPNANQEALDKFVKQLEFFKQQQTNNGITLLSRDVTINGTVETLDGMGVVHKVNVAGTLDVLGYDNKGNWYIYDMKTHLSANLSQAKIEKYERQLTLYKKLLEDKYGIKIKSLNIIPIKVSYPLPEGTRTGTAKYTVAQYKHPSYQGKKSNQLLIDGEYFRGANPKLEPIRTISNRDLNLKYRKLANDPTNGTGNAVMATKDAIATIDNKYSMLASLFTEKGMAYFVEFLKPFVGENIKIRDIDPVTKRPKSSGKMRVVSIKHILEESSRDASLAQRWFSTMADNPDGVLQIFDKVVKRTKDIKDKKVLDKSKEILALGLEFEKKGIKNYDFIYESDKKNYVCRLVVDGVDYSFDRSAYEEAKRKYKATLDTRYGEHPEVGSTEYKEKNNALKKWIEDNIITIKDEDDKAVRIPDPTVYPSKYKSFTDTQKEFYNKWMALKAEMDGVIGPNKTKLLHTIKIRKQGIERWKSALQGKGVTELVNEAKSRIMRSYDDDINYTASGIRGFNGEEIMRLPLYYINEKADTKDLSTDAISTLLAYMEMAYTYEAMNTVVNPLEIGREIITVRNPRKIQSLRGNRPIHERFKFRENYAEKPVLVEMDKSNFKALLDDFFESKIYNRYLKDSGEIGKIDVNKGASWLLKLGSTVQLGFNLMAGVANIWTGLSMQNIEAAAGEFFTAKELAKADSQFLSCMPAYLAESGKRVKNSKLALFDEMFNVRQNMPEVIKNKRFVNRNLLTRIFGPRIQYFCQDSGDHWLYNRACIAIALNYKMKDANGPISLWDALSIVDVVPGKPELGKKMIIKEGVTKADGSMFTEEDLSDIKGRMRYINQHCFGVYNAEDAIAARRTLWGRFLMQYRDFLPAQFRYRFGVRTTNLEKGIGEEVEGYYRTVGRLISDLATGKEKLGQVWNHLEDFEKRNIKRAVTEVTQYLILLGLRALIKGMKGDDDDKSWLRQMIEYGLTREKTELGAQIPITMPMEYIRILKSPFANTNIIADINELTACANPYNWFDEIESGDYAGHSSAYRAFMRSPITLWYRTIKRHTDPQKAEAYFSRF